MSSDDKAPNASLPLGWAYADLNDIGALFCGQSPPSATVNDCGKGTPYISGPHQWDGSALRLDKWTTAPGRLVPEGSVFVTVKGAGVGSVFPGVPAAIGRDIYAYVPEPDVSAGFVTHILRFTAAEVVRRAHGDIPGLSKDHILKHQIPLPPSAEQARIADALDELLSDLDVGVAATEQVRVKLAHYRASVLKAAVEGTLTAEWRQQHPNTEPASELLKRILAERRRHWEEEQLRKSKERGQRLPENWKAKYRDPSPPDIGDLSPLPEGWCWATMDQLAWASGYGTSQKCRETDTGLAVLRIPNIIRGDLDLTTLKYASAEHSADHDDLVGIGDLLVVRTNGSQSLIGRGAVIRTTPALPLGFASYLIRLRLAPSPDLLEWVSFLWQSSHVRHWIETHAATSAGQFNISLGVLTTLAVPLPPSEEQEVLAEYLEDQLSVIEHLENDLEARVQSAQALRHSILRHAFTGQLVPQDSNDEPASELLKRIAAERARRPKKATKES